MTPFVEDLIAQSCCSEQCGPVALCETAFCSDEFLNLVTAFQAAKFWCAVDFSVLRPEIER